MSENLNQLVDNDEKITVELGKENFSKLLAIINLISKPCTDLNIKNGFLRQSSDNRQVLYCMNLSSIIMSNNIMLSNIVSKLKLLNPFKNQQVDVKLDIYHNRYVFYDSYTKYSFLKPIEKYINAEYIEESVFLNRLNINHNIEPIFEVIFQKWLVDRLNASVDALNSFSIDLIFNNNIANFKIMSDHDNIGTTTIDLLEVKDIQQNLSGSFFFPISPFQQSDELKVTCYRSNKENELVIKIESNIANMPIEMYCRSAVPKK